ncbi:MAG: HK97 gp10 family phage protein, partial [Clostridia bacterium]|nr:HK97 gp10 family phage protein [Clostridia bacterium]
MSIKITDNTDEVLSSLEKAIKNGLTAIGMTAEGHAKKAAPVDTGRLRNSITHAVKMDEKAAYIGTNVEYAPYVELGTV